MPKKKSASTKKQFSNKYGFVKPPSLVDKIRHKKTKPMPIEEDSGEPGIPFAQHTARSCLWPMRGRGLTLEICGVTVKESINPVNGERKLLPYCAAHCDKAYVVPKHRLTVPVS